MYYIPQLVEKNDRLRTPSSIHSFSIAMRKHLTILTALLLLGAGCSRSVSPTPTTPTSTGNPSATSTTSTTPAATSTVSIRTQKQNIIQVDNLPDNTLIQSPLTVTGKARGTWYFEASFPIELRDGNGVLLAQTPAQAQGDWMTINSVPFSATLTFNQPTTPQGTLILRKDNPSGEPQYDDQLVIPVTF